MAKLLVYPGREALALGMQDFVSQFGLSRRAVLTFITEHKQLNSYSHYSHSILACAEQGLCNGRASVRPSSAGLLLCARRAGDIDRLL